VPQFTVIPAVVILNSGEATERNLLIVTNDLYSGNEKRKIGTCTLRNRIADGQCLPHLMATKREVAQTISNQEFLREPSCPLWFKLEEQIAGTALF
jgi:hypothetical protein